MTEWVREWDGLVNGWLAAPTCLGDEWLVLLGGEVFALQQRAHHCCERSHLRVRACKQEREKIEEKIERVSVCVCVCERERERERETESEMR